MGNDALRFGIVLSLTMIFAFISPSIAQAIDCSTAAGQLCEGYAGAACMPYDNYQFNCDQFNIYHMGSYPDAHPCGDALTLDWLKPHCWCFNQEPQVCPSGQVCAPGQGCVVDPEGDGDKDSGDCIVYTNVLGLPWILDRTIYNAWESGIQCYSYTSATAITYTNIWIGSGSSYQAYYTCGNPSADVRWLLDPDIWFGAIPQVFCRRDSNDPANTCVGVEPGTGETASGNDYSTCVNNLRCKNLGYACSPLAGVFAYTSGWTPINVQSGDWNSRFEWAMPGEGDVVYAPGTAAIDGSGMIMSATCDVSGTTYKTDIKFPMREVTSITGNAWYQACLGERSVTIGSLCFCDNCQYCTGYTIGDAPKLSEALYDKIQFSGSFNYSWRQQYCEGFPCGYAWENSNTGCMEEIQDRFKNYCFYGENCQSMYNIPSFSNRTTSGSLFCECESSDKAAENFRDCGHSGDGNGACVNMTHGFAFSGVDCTNTGWDVENVINGEITKFIFSNARGNYISYTGCDKDRGARDMVYFDSGAKDCTSKSVSSPAPAYNGQHESVLFTVTVKNSGTRDMLQPVILFTQPGYDPDDDTEYTDLLTTIGTYKTIDVRFSEESGYPVEGTCYQTGDLGGVNCVTQGLHMQNLFSGRYYGFWLNRDGIARTSNVERVDESGTVDGILSPGEEMTLVLRLNGRVWKGRDVAVYFWDIKSPLRQNPAAGSPDQYNDVAVNALPNEYLASFAFDGDQVEKYDLDFDYVRAIQVIEDNEIVDNKINMAGNVSYARSDEVSVSCGTAICTTLGGSAACMAWAGLNIRFFDFCPPGYSPIKCAGNNLICSQNTNFNCDDCLQCVASRMDTDSFDVIWARKEEKVSPDNINTIFPFIPVSGIYKWAGIFFMPRAYNIALRTNPAIDAGVSTRVNSSDSKRFAVGLFTHEADARDFASRFRSPPLVQEPEGGFGAVLSNASLFMVPQLTPITISAVKDSGVITDFEGYKVTFNGEECVLDSDSSCLLSQGASATTSYTVEARTPDDVPLTEFSISLFNGTVPYPEFDADLNMLTRPDLLGGNITDDGVLEIITLAAADPGFLWVTMMPFPYALPAEGYGIIFKNDEQTIQGTIPSNGLWTVDVSAEDTIPDSWFFLVDEDGDFVTGMGFVDQFKIKCITNCNGQADRSTFQISVNGTYIEGLKVVAYNPYQISGGVLSQIGGSQTDPNGYAYTDSDGYVGIDWYDTCNPPGCPGIDKHLDEINESSPQDTIMFIQVNDSNDEIIGMGYFGLGDTLDIEPDMRWEFGSGYMGGYDTKQKITVTNYDTFFRHGEPIEYTLYLPELDSCSKVMVWDSDNKDFVPHQIIEENIQQGYCRVLFQIDLAAATVFSPEVRNFAVYYGINAPELTYPSDWANVTVTSSRVNIMTDVIDAIYDLDCDSYTGPCIRRLNRTANQQWASDTILWDQVDVRGYEDFNPVVTHDGPVMKCVGVNYEARDVVEVNATRLGVPVTTTHVLSQPITREICVYKSLPVIFDSIKVENDYINHTLMTSVPILINELEVSDGVFTDTIPNPGTDLSDQTFGNYMIYKNFAWGQYMGVYWNTTDYIDYNFVQQAEYGKDTYLSDIHIAQDHIEILLPDNQSLSNISASMNLDFETIASWDNQAPVGDWLDAENWGVSTGSMNYYSRSWLTSGSSQNCDPEDSDEDLVYGTTCDLETTDEELQITFGIMRTGAHPIDFMNVRESTGKEPQMTIVNEMGESAREISGDALTKCDITNNYFDCILTHDEKGQEINTSLQGYVVSCIVYDDKDEIGTPIGVDMQDFVTRYLHPYVHPLEWDINFDIVVNPYARIPIPVKIEEKAGQIVISSCGDGICQRELDEFCYNCPMDCLPPMVERFVPEMK